MRRILWFVVTLALAFTGTAHAYIDPAAGSLMLQVILGGVAGLGVAYRVLRGRLRNWWNARSSGANPPPPPEVRG